MRTLILATATSLMLAGAGLTPPAALGAQGKPAADATSAKPATSADLDRLLAPIALYPDQLLAQMLLCASNPGKLGALSEWLASNETLKGSPLQDAATKAGFEPQFVALILFPKIVHTMASQLEWTTRLGQTFEADRSAVFASIQRLRSQAQKAGTLKTTPQQNVETRTTSSGQQVIVIEPANSQVVYVPQYNPQVVYTQPTTTSTVVVQSESSSADAVAAGLIGFTAGIAIGAAMDNDYYYGPYGWHGGFYMYDDAWDDWYDAREDAREDWQEHREDLVEERGERREELADERGERARTQQEQRTERQQTRQETRPETQAARQERRTEAQAAAPATAGASTYESRGYSGDRSRATQRSDTGSDAFSGYSSGSSTRAASERGQRSRSGSRGGGGRR
jgi:hypothetical protein